MRTYDNGSGFTVCYSAPEADAFSASWPCSTVKYAGSFSFDGNGDLIAMSSVFDGSDWLAFSHDCQAWGEAHIVALRKGLARKAAQND